MPGERCKIPQTHCLICFLVLLAFSLLAVPAIAGDYGREYVPEFDAFFKLSDTTRLFLLADVTNNQTEGTTDGEVGAHLDFTLKPMLRPHLNQADWARERYLWMRVGYQALGSPDNRGSGPEERRAILELTGRVPLPNQIWLVNRGRVDLRELGGEPSQRYRLRVGLERETIVAGVVTVPYAQAEAYYDTRYDSLNRMVYQFGAEIALTKQWRIEPYYARQDDTRSTLAHVDRIGLVLKYFH
jgi:hypothetical protein